MKKYIPVSGKVFDESEINNAIKVAKDGWWTEGEYGGKFRQEFSKYLGVKFVSLVNSGSSANLVAVAALTSKSLGKKRLKPGDEYITCAVGFPTTVNPGIQYGLKPVFVDAQIDSFNIDMDQVEKAISNKTKLIMIAHTLGKPVDMDKLMKLVKKYDLWLIEDCCDGLGSRFGGKLVSNFGHMATFSFYPAHHITMGEGGAVVTDDPKLFKAIKQFRDWGRDCWCDPGQDNACGSRFKMQLGELPYGYDHKYTYSQIGYNLKLTDFGPAIGLAQLTKLDKFIKLRKNNYKLLFNFFSQYIKYFELLKTNKKEEVSWFGFPLLVKEEVPFSRNNLTEYLEENGIGTRNVFSGNILRHPAYIGLKNKRVIGNLEVADRIMNQAFWLGVWPGISKKDYEYMFEVIEKFMKKF